MDNYNIIVLVTINLIFMLGWVAILGNPFLQEGKKKVKKGWLRHLVRNKRLTPLERLGARIGYLGAGLLIAAQWTIAPPLYIAGFICVLFQTAVRKQWNLVALQVNGLIAWIIHLLY